MCIMCVHTDKYIYLPGALSPALLHEAVSRDGISIATATEDVVT